MSIENEDALSRAATNLALIAGAISTLAEAINGTYKGNPIYAQQGALPPAEPQKRGRGRPVKGEDQPATGAVAPVAGSTNQAATVAAAAPLVGIQTTALASVAADPFAEAAPAPALPTATLDDVRNALTALRAATSQEIALGILKSAGGADNLTGLAVDKYGAVVVAAKAKQAEYAKPAAVPAADPFEVQASAAAKPLTIEDVKAAVVEAQKRTSQDTVQKVVMQHGGKAAGATGVEGPSLKALPEAQFGTVIEALKALPATK